MRYLASLILLFYCFPATSQEATYYRVKEKVDSVELKPEDNYSLVVYQMSGLFEKAKKITYIDSANGFKVDVPKWLYLKETNNLNMFGGTMPPIGDVENAVLILSFKKSQYQSFNDFKNFVIEDPGYTVGASPKWQNDRKFLAIQKDQSSFKNLDSYKVTVDRQGYIFVSNFVMLETEAAYIWIQFTATKSTYSKNLSKFQDFVQGFKTVL